MRKLYIGLVLGSIVAVFAVYGEAINTDDVINACYDRNTGALRKVTTAGECRNQEGFVTWSIEGPQGPPGPQGDPGISKAFSTSKVFGGDLEPNAGPPPNGTRVLNLDLPAGKYVADSKLSIFSSQGYDVTCHLATGPVAGGFVDRSTSHIVSNSNAMTTLPLHGAFEITTATNLSVWCSGSGAWSNAQLSAIKVNELETQGPAPF
jgi:hypothetical protein